MQVDVASPRRRFIALTLTGNPESGFQRDKDVVRLHTDLHATHRAMQLPICTHLLIRTHFLH